MQATPQDKLHASDNNGSKHESVAKKRSLRAPSTQVILALGPKVEKWDLLPAIGRLRATETLRQATQRTQYGLIQEYTLS